jgi:hypothetical protein
MEPYVSDLGVSSNFKFSSVFKCSANICCVCCGLHLVCTRLLFVVYLQFVYLYIAFYVLLLHICLLYLVICYCVPCICHMLFCFPGLISWCALCKIYSTRRPQHINELLFS